MSQDEKPTGEVEVKAFESFEIKNEATGEVEAIIATLNVVDKDFEVITKDAIPDGSKVKMSSYGHDIVGMFAAGSLPVGKGLSTSRKTRQSFAGRCSCPLNEAAIRWPSSRRWDLNNSGRSVSGS